MDEPYTLRLSCHKHPQHVRTLTVYVGDEAPPCCPTCNGPMREPAGIRNLVADNHTTGY